MAPAAADRISRKILEAKTPEDRDFYLDQYADCLLRATEWDGQEWGFFEGEVRGRLNTRFEEFDAFWTSKGDTTYHPAEPHRRQL